MAGGERVWTDVTHVDFDAVVSAVSKILLDGGPDSVHLSTVSAALGMTTRELEQDFGHPGELLFLTWDLRLRTEFEQLVDQAVAILEGRWDSSNDDLARSPQRRAMSHLLVVTGRFDELREAVPFDVQRILFERDRYCDNDAERSALRAVIGWLLGIAVEPGSDFGDSLRLLHAIGWSRQRLNEVNQTNEVERTPALLLEFDEAGDMSKEILAACTRIVAKGGVGRATLLRIARMTGFPPEVLYSMFGRQEYLIAEYISYVFALLFSYPRFEQYMSSPAHAIMRLEVWLEPDLQLRRRALLECVMASSFSPFMESAFVDAAQEALADMRLANLQSSESDLEVAGIRFIASRQITLGLAILDDVELENWTRNWSPFLRVFLTRVE